MENTTHPVNTRHRRVQMRMSTWLNIADCVLWMARCRSFWGERGGLPPARRARGEMSSKHHLLPCWLQQCPPQ